MSVRTTLSYRYFYPYWRLASFLVLLGYIFLAVGYTVRIYKSPWITFSLLPFISLGRIELMGLIFSFYLLFLIAYSSRKSDRRNSSLAVLAYLVLFFAQILICWGLLNETYPIFLWGVTLRGVTFLPTLWVALMSQPR